MKNLSHNEAGLLVIYFLELPLPDKIVLFHKFNYKFDLKRTDAELFRDIFANCKKTGQLEEFYKINE